MFHLVYYARSFNFSSCLEGVPLEVFKKLGSSQHPRLCFLEDLFLREV